MKGLIELRSPVALLGGGCHFPFLICQVRADEVYFHKRLECTRRLPPEIIRSNDYNSPSFVIL